MHLERGGEAIDRLDAALDRNTALLAFLDRLENRPGPAT
jgi:hypothetical protein